MVAMHVSRAGQRTEGSGSVRRRRRRRSCVTKAGGAGMYGAVGGGTWSWGNKFLWGYTPSQERDARLEEAFHQAIRCGLRLVDTADSYGTGKLEGKAEELLGKFLMSYDGEEGKKVVVATKLAPYPWRLTRGSLITAAQRSLARLGGAREHIDVVQLHWSTQRYNPWQEEVLWDGIADVVEKGMARSVGLSNYGPEQLERAHRYLTKERGIPISLVQSQISLLSQEALLPGNLKAVTDDLGIDLLAYSPLALGLLTDKYMGREEQTVALPPGPRGLLFRNLLKKMEPLKREMNRVASERNCSTSQVALAWCVSKGTIPIPGISQKAQVLDNMEAARSPLKEEDIQELDKASMASGQMVQGGGGGGRGGGVCVCGGRVKEHTNHGHHPQVQNIFMTN